MVSHLKKGKITYIPHSHMRISSTADHSSIYDTIKISLTLEENTDEFLCNLSKGNIF